MRYLSFCALFSAALLLVSAGPTSGQSSNMITICHNGQTIQVDQSAWSAHQQHGDTQGACPDDGSGGKFPDKMPDVEPPSPDKVKGYLEQSITIVKNTIGPQRWNSFRNLVASLPFVSQLGTSGLDQLIFSVILLTLALFVLALVAFLTYYVLFYVAIAGVIVSGLLLLMTFVT